MSMCVYGGQKKSEHHIQLITLNRGWFRIYYVNLFVYMYLI